MSKERFESSLTSKVSNLSMTSKLNLQGVQKSVYGVQCMSNVRFTLASSNTYDTNSSNTGYLSVGAGLGPD